jgi:hypothetical protein
MYCSYFNVYNLNFNVLYSSSNLWYVISNVDPDSFVLNDVFVIVI